jgi:cytochrome c biogenesis protein CcdA
MWAYGLSFAAGAITILSPCVLPVLPVVVGSAGQQHRYGPLVLAAGLIVSFAAAGTVIASAGLAIGLDNSVMRSLAAALLIIVGLVLVSSQLQHRVEGLAAPLANAAGRLLDREVFSGLRGQFFVGTLLGAVWSPCSGSTLGAAIGLASQSGTMLRAAAMMLFFGAGAAVPILAVGYGAKSVLMQNRRSWLRVGVAARGAMGAALMFAGVVVLTGADKVLESAILGHLPAGWVNFVTRY